jgi:DNA-directed RNA polymerase subunit RPC12/RpoP
MFVNTACPKCGGQATEYEVEKWSCPFCGNKFILSAEPSHTFVQSNIHIQGQATFALDVSKATQPFPKFVKMGEHDPDCFGKRIADNAFRITIYQRQASRNKLLKNLALVFCLLMWLFGGLILLPILQGPKGPDERLNFTLAIQGLVLLAILSPILVFAFIHAHKEVCECNLMIKKLQETNFSFHQQNQMAKKIGDYIVCPHCGATSDYFLVNSPPPIEGLKHCLKCGREFFTKGLLSYPVLFDK